MPGITDNGKGASKYDAIPGPLGLASASLEGKVALVTGAGKSSSKSTHVHYRNTFSLLGVRFTDNPT